LLINYQIIYDILSISHLSHHLSTLYIYHNILPYLESNNNSLYPYLIIIYSHNYQTLMLSNTTLSYLLTPTHPVILMYSIYDSLIMTNYPSPTIPIHMSILLYCLYPHNNLLNHLIYLSPVMYLCLCYNFILFIN